MITKREKTLLVLLLFLLTLSFAFTQYQLYRAQDHIAVLYDAVNTQTEILMLQDKTISELLNMQQTPRPPFPMIPKPRNHSYNL